MWEGGRAGACPGCGPACKRAELSSDRDGLPEIGGSGRGGAALLDGGEDGEEARPTGPPSLWGSMGPGSPPRLEREPRPLGKLRISHEAGGGEPAREPVSRPS